MPALRQRTCTIASRLAQRRRSVSSASITCVHRPQVDLDTATTRRLRARHGTRTHNDVQARRRSALSTGPHLLFLVDQHPGLTLSGGAVLHGRSEGGAQLPDPLLLDLRPETEDKDASRVEPVRLCSIDRCSPRPLGSVVTVLHPRALCPKKSAAGSVSRVPNQKEHAGVPLTPTSAASVLRCASKLSCSTCCCSATACSRLAESSRCAPADGRGTCFSMLSPKAKMF